MMESTQQEDQTIKQALYQRKRSDKELITYRGNGGGGGEPVRNSEEG